MKQALRYNNKVVKKIYQGDELVKKMNYGQSSDVFQYIKNDGDTPTPPAPVPYDEQYLTIESTSDNNTIYWLSLFGSTKTISVSTDNGTTWTEYESTNVRPGTAIATLNTGGKLLLKGTEEAYEGNGAIDSTSSFIVYGNIMSLIYDDNFSGQTTLTSNAFNELFFQCTGLTSAENLILPATTLAKYCYYGMFYMCTSLTTAPVLPATTLADTCYAEMFENCTSLTVAPVLSATTLAESCYWQMFYGCTSLTSAPQLPATTLVSNCYYQMFYDCTSLTTAPALPATTLAESCYMSMFQGCTSLTSAPELPTTTLADYCYYQMFYGCTNLTTAPALPATTLAKYCYYEMFRGCTSLTTAPSVLPATTLAWGCYGHMFYGCTNLNYIKCLATDISANNCTTSWVDGVAANGTFVKAASMSSWTTGSNDGIPTGWSVVNA